MQQSIPTPERFSILAGLSVVIVATVPRYIAAGHDTQLSLILMALAVVATMTLFQWRLLSREARGRLPGLLKRLVVLLIVGVGVMTAWHAVVSDWFSWQLLLSHGTTLGLLLHALGLWWAAESS
ncbi:hypothetical protein R5M92_04485 [Halomonas sp. Bachu 37]|uniref:hypothetical protein n=1 Tax=Halomonas kashgarensis TaxID=3084920 RepID=UPI00321696FC